MPQGKGTYGSKVGRPAKSAASKMKKKGVPAAVRKAIVKNMKKKWHGTHEGPQEKCQSKDWQT